MCLPSCVYEVSFFVCGNAFGDEGDGEKVFYWVTADEVLTEGGHNTGFLYFIALPCLSFLFPPLISPLPQEPPFPSIYFFLLIVFIPTMSFFSIIHQSVHSSRPLPIKTSFPVLLLHYLSPSLFRHL